MNQKEQAIPTSLYFLSLLFQETSLKEVILIPSIL